MNSDITYIFAASELHNKLLNYVKNYSNNDKAI